MHRTRGGGVGRRERVLLINGQSKRVPSRRVSWAEAVDLAFPGERLAPTPGGHLAVSGVPGDQVRATDNQGELHALRGSRPACRDTGPGGYEGGAKARTEPMRAWLSMTASQHQVLIGRGVIESENLCPLPVTSAKRPVAIRQKSRPP